MLGALSSLDELVALPATRSLPSARV
jgi:hypothetical protein